MESAFHGAFWEDLQQDLLKERSVAELEAFKCQNVHISTHTRHFQHNDHHMSTRCPTDQGKGQMAGTEAMASAANEQLLEAAEHGWLDEVKELLQSRADLESRSQLGFDRKRTPLHLAALYGQIDVVRFLLEKSAKIEATDADEKTPLHLAVVGARKDVVQVLLQKNAEIEAKSSSGQTPLFLAKENDHVEVAQLLLEKNAQIGTTDKDGQTVTPISYASGKVVDVLLDHIPKQEAWSWSLVCHVLSLDNQEQVVKFLDMWPQKAMTFRWLIETLESMKRAQLPERLRAVLARRRDQEEIKDVVVGDYDVRLGDQNLFWSQEVAVTLKVLPGVVGSDAVRNNFLQILADTPHDAVFETDAVQAMILAAWHQERVFTWLEIGSCIVMVMVLCCSSYGFRHGLLTFATTSLWLAAILHIKKTFDEIVQVPCTSCTCFVFVVVRL